MNMPVDYNGYYTNELDMYNILNNGNILIEKNGYNLYYNRYTYYDYIYAITSNIDLIHRCYAISDVALNNSIALLTCNDRKVYSARCYINLDINSCKLLISHGCSYSNLFIIACRVYNYDTIMYIINQLISNEELCNVFTQHRSDINININIHYILLLHQINVCNNELHTLMQNFIMSLSNNNLKHIVIKAFFVIKFMSRDEGYKFRDEQKDVTFINVVNQEVTSDYVKSQYFILLEYHLRPRGGYTKQAITCSQ
jgi:hypothetical protein